MQSLYHQLELEKNPHSYALAKYLKQNNTSIRQSEEEKQKLLECARMLQERFDTDPFFRYHLLSRSVDGREKELGLILDYLITFSLKEGFSSARDLLAQLKISSAGFYGYQRI